MPRPLIIAHRGYHTTATENTVEALRAALAIGVDGVEFDVRSSKDDVPVIFHDPHSKRLSARRHRIKDLAIQEIQRLPLPYGEIIPTLDQVLGIPGLDSKLVVIECKTGESVQQIIEYVNRTKLNAITISFEPRHVKRFREARPNAPAGLLTVSNRKTIETLLNWLPSDRKIGVWETVLHLTLRYFPVTTAKRVHATHLILERRTATKRAIRRAHAAGLQVFVWNVNTPYQISTYLARNADGIITDEPETALRICKEMFPS